MLLLTFAVVIFVNRNGTAAAWRGFRRHLRGRAGARRRRGRRRRCWQRASGIAATAAAALFRHRGRRGDDEPASACVAPKLMHKAGFHPTAVLSGRWRWPRRPSAKALGLNPAPDRRCARDRRQHGAPGIIEYLAEGAWTKRMHAGWAAQSGLRAALLAQRRLRRAAHRVSRGPTACSTASPTPARGRLIEALIGDFCNALGHRDARLQALSVRDHGASLYRLRAGVRGAAASRPATSGKSCARFGEGTVHRLWGSRSPTSGGLPNGLCGRNSDALLHRRPASCAATSGCARFHRRRGEGPCAIARPRRQGPLRRRPRQSLSRTTSPATSARR